MSSDRTTALADPATAAMTPAMEAAFRACVHCGFCLAACPTYRELGEEMDSPRGRIVLMKQVVDGTLPAEDASPYLDRCLGCLACEPACPSGVPYRDLISPVRARIESRRRRSPGDRLRRALLGAVLPHPGRFRWALRAARLAKPFKGHVPAALRGMLELAPDRLPQERFGPGHYPPPGDAPARARVLLVPGCAQQVLAPSINAATVRVLNRNGVDVTVPADAPCCGALAWHTGDLRQARRLARAAIRSLAPGDAFDAVVTNAAGCGSAIHEYPLVLAGEPEEAEAKSFAARTADVAAFLDEIGLTEPPPATVRPLAVAYQDACHLSNGQGVTSAPRRLLASVPGLEVREIADAHLCCGSAGTYNLEQPETAASLGRQKAAAIAATGAALAATGNIGCLVQIRQHAALAGHGFEVLHTMEVLDRAYRDELG